MSLREVLIVINFAHYLIRISLIRDDLDIFVLVLKTCRDRNTLGCLNLVASEHPNLNASLSQCVNCLEHILLQFVFNTSHSKELHFILERHDCFRDFLLAIAHASFSGLQTRSEVIVLGIGNQFLGDDKRSESVAGEILAELLARGPLTGLHLWSHNDISAFHVEDDFTTLLVFHDDAHTLRLRAEWEVL